MPDYKLLALDVDGTLLTSRQVIAKETRRAVQRALAAGVRVTLATGRAYPSARLIAQELGLHAPLVTHDGGYVADPSSGAVLAAVRLPPEVVSAAVAILAGAGLEVHLLHEAFAVSNSRLGYRLRLAHLRRWRALPLQLRTRFAYPHTYAPDLVSYLRRRPVAPPKLFVTGPARRLAAARAELEAGLGADLHITSSGPQALEVTARHVSKASGLAVLLRAWGLTPAQMIAVGDAPNDIDMIRLAGLGVAMGQAPEEVRRHARCVTASNDENGVARVIERFLLRGGAGRRR